MTDKKRARLQVCCSEAEAEAIRQATLRAAIAGELPTSRASVSAYILLAVQEKMNREKRKGAQWTTYPD